VDMDKEITDKDLDLLNKEDIINIVLEEVMMVAIEEEAEVEVVVITIIVVMEEEIIDKVFTPLNNLNNNNLTVEDKVDKVDKEDKEDTLHNRPLNNLLVDITVNKPLPAHLLPLVTLLVQLPPLVTPPNNTDLIFEQ